MKNGVFFTLPTPKNHIFCRILPKIHDFPVYKGSKITKKIAKNADEVSGFFHIFWSKSQYMGPLQTPKIVKIHENPRFSAGRPPPPKIIKNRLNFAHSEICEKSDFNPILTSKLNHL